MTRLFGLADAMDSDAWYTPPWVFEGMGVTFDLDVCSPSTPPSWIPADERLTVADDGLGAEWRGWIWCNPPYSDPRPWCLRWAVHEPGGCLLIRADLSASGPAAAFAAASSLYVPAARIRFISGSGIESRRVPFTTIILGRGALADAALDRLARCAGGTTRRLGLA